MNAIDEYFQLIWDLSHTTVNSMPSVPLDEGAFPAFLEVDISGDVFEVPVSLLLYVERAKRYGYNKLVFNLINGSDGLGRRTVHKKSISTILKQFKLATNTMRIAHVVTSKELHYYGSQGMIFNADYEPLMLGTIVVEYNSNTNRIVNLTHPRFRLSYKVFENSSEIVEKTIIKQAIPYYANNSITVFFRDICESCKVETTIENFNSMIVKPSTPSLSTTNMADFNDTIARLYETY